MIQMFLSFIIIVIIATLSENQKSDTSVFVFHYYHNQLCSCGAYGLKPPTSQARSPAQLLWERPAPRKAKLGDKTNILGRSS